MQITARTRATEATTNERVLYIVYILPLSQPDAGWKHLSTLFSFSSYRCAATMQEQPHAPAGGRNFSPRPNRACQWRLLRQCASRARPFQQLTPCRKSLCGPGGIESSDESLFRMGPIETAIYLLPLQVHKNHNSSEPVEDVCKNRANYVVSNSLSDSPGACLWNGDGRTRGTIRPAKEAAKDCPTPVIRVLGIAAVKMPDISANIECAGTIATSLASLAAQAIGRRRNHFNVCV